MPSDPHDWLREPGRGKYAQAERERRFLVSGIVPAGSSTRLVEDRYLEGLRLRLRRVTSDGHVIHKLTQKVRVEEADPTEVLLTNMYLCASEYERLLALPGHDLAKTRTVVAAASGSLVVDELHGRLEGLRLAEIEVDDLAQPLDLPQWIGQEVTRDDRYTGGRLAAANDHDLQELLTAPYTAPT